MSEYTEKLNELDKKLEILGFKLKEAKEWCQETIKKFDDIQAEHKQRRRNNDN